MAVYAAMTVGNRVLFTFEAKDWRSALNIMRTLRTKGEIITSLHMLRRNDKGVNDVMEWRSPKPRKRKRKPHAR